jgi:hypothetical protein
MLLVSQRSFVGHVRPTRSGAPFPSGALGCWLGVFCAAVALVTVWGPQVGLTTKIVATAAFFAVPMVVVAFWLGQRAEHRAARKHGPLNGGRAERDHPETR